MSVDSLKSLHYISEQFRVIWKCYGLLLLENVIRFYRFNVFFGCNQLHFYLSIVESLLEWLYNFNVSIKIQI